ncbi:MAG TPA: hypothetical protein VKY92_20975 [Verrucomicrobiae bacterium]|nr:hypothetical protein [Verrucomicrobiae bacterium]
MLGKGDLGGASLSARQVLRLDPSNAVACRLMADVCERSRSPALLDWLRRLCDHQPASSNQLRLAACALRLERPPYRVARETLRVLEPALQDRAGFQILSAELDLKSNRLEDARWHFAKAASLDPENPLHKLNIAVLDLQSTNAAVATAARRSLEELSAGPRLGALALRWLVMDELRRTNLEAAAAISLRLLARPGAQLEDRLRYVAVLQQQHEHARMVQELQNIQADAGTNLVDLFTVCEWMGQHELANEGLSWLGELSPESLRVQPMPLAYADLLVSKKDWNALEGFLANQKWGELEFLKIAMLSRAAAGRQEVNVQAARWSVSIRLAGDRLGALDLLLSLAEQWGFSREEVLWTIARRFPKEERWALDELEQDYLAGRDTRGLNRVSAQRLQSSPSGADLTNGNNFATTSMLLGINLAKAHSVARELYHRERADPLIASTYAYSLHLQGRTAEALELLRPLEAVLRETPSAAFYYGILLAAAGDTKAAEFLALIDSNKLLPEEKQLLSDARLACSQFKAGSGPSKPPARKAYRPS